MRCVATRCFVTSRNKSLVRDFLKKRRRRFDRRSGSVSIWLIIPLFSGYLKTKDSMSHDIPQKRQLSPGQISGIALPIVTEAINGAAKARAYTTSGTEPHYNPSPSLMGSTLGWSESPEYLRMPYPFTRGFLPVPFRAPVSHSPLGSILILGKQSLVSPNSILHSIKPLYSYGLKRFI